MRLMFGSQREGEVDAGHAGGIVVDDYE